jgi:hypothetical protein
VRLHIKVDPRKRLHIVPQESIDGETAN